MAKTQRNEYVEDKEKEPESLAHKRRREEKQRFKSLVLDPPFEDDDFDEEFDTFEPIRRKQR